MAEIMTAAMIVIGDEILSGRTKDRNIGHLADVLTAIGIDLKEVRIVPDEEDEIVAAVNALRARYGYVFTTGGIGPTHDDITADAIAAAFGVGIGLREDARALLAAHYERAGLEFNSARQRMGRIPDGARLIDNPVSIAPGFTIGNVHVMAGVPDIFAAMLASVLPGLTGGAPLLQAHQVSCASLGVLLHLARSAHTRDRLGPASRVVVERPLELGPRRGVGEPLRSGHGNGRARVPPRRGDQRPRIGTGLVGARQRPTADSGGEGETTDEPPSQRPAGDDGFERRDGFGHRAEAPRRVLGQAALDDRAQRLGTGDRRARLARTACNRPP